LLNRNQLLSALKGTAPLFFFLVVALAFTWPLPLNMSDRVVATGSGDIWQHLWNIWWVRFSLLDLHSLPYNTSLLFYPTGANLFFHALDPLDGYISIPFQLIFGLVAAFNLVILFQITLAGWATYLLASYLTGNRRAGLVAGIIYACSPLESRLITLGQLELTSIEWIPLFIFAFIKSFDRNQPGRGVWVWRILSALCLVVLALVSWYYLLYAFLLGGLYGLYLLFRERKGWRERWAATLLNLGLVFGGAGLPVLPLLVATLKAAGSGTTSQPIFTVIYNSATLKGFLTPGPSALWGLFGSSDNHEFRGNFLGFIALGLAWCGLVTGYKKNWFWVLVAAVFGLLALGPVLHLSFNPDWTPQTIEGGPSLPGRLLYNLPFGNIARVPLRFGLVTFLALAVLAAFGLNWLESKLFRRPVKFLPARWGGWLPAALAGLLVFLEFFPGIRPLIDTAVPAVYTQLAAESSWNDFAVLETPDRDDASIISKAMYYQTVQGHPMVGGYLSRKPTYPFKNYSGIQELLALEERLNQRDILDRASLRNVPGVLNFYNIRYVIVHTSLLSDPDRLYNANRLLQTVFGPDTKPYYQDSQLQVWQTPTFIEQKDTSPRLEKMLPELGEGWGKRLDTPSGPQRVVASQARLALFNPFPSPMSLTLQVRVAREDQKVSLKTALNQKEINFSETAALSGTVQIKLTLAPGPNDLIFTTSGNIYFGSFTFSSIS